MPHSLAMFAVVTALTVPPAPAAGASVPNLDLPIRAADPAPAFTVPARHPPAASRGFVPGSNLARSLAAGAQLPPPAIAPAAAPAQLVRTGTVNGAPLRSTQTAVVPYKMLYAPAAEDDPSFRAELAALTGGTVDYFDARNNVPSAVQLAGYTSVYTWPNSAYINATLMGDRLADYVDAGGKVILGAFCTFNSNSALAGRIMQAGYAPVFSPLGNNHLTLSSYAGDGSSSLHAGVLAYASPYRDYLALRAGNYIDGHYQDGEIATAYRSDGRVVYVNGGVANATGNWARLVANAWIGIPSARSILYAPSAAAPIEDCVAIGAATLGPVTFFDARTGTPAADVLATYDCVYTFASEPFADPALMGNRLADFVDGGGRVILGTYTAGGGSPLGGRIMTAAYCPVRATGAHSGPSIAWMSDVPTCLQDQAPSYAAFFRDRLVGQGVGRADGHFEDGEIAFAWRPDGRIVYCNGVAGSMYSTGAWAQVVANAATCSISSSPPVLYAPADVDDPTLRAALSSVTGGPVVYFDARAATPTVALMQTYSAVFTWANEKYSDAVLFGNRLAEFVDGGGRVVLGPYCTFTQGNALAGAIMGPAYSPVTAPGGAILATTSAYAGDGVTRFLHGVGTFDSQVRDSLALQGAGVADARYADGNIALAYRPDRRVVYLNGGLLTGAGDWAVLHANAFQAPRANGILYAASITGELLTLNLSTGAGAHAGSLPAGGANEIEIDESNGRCWYQLREGTWAAQEVFFRTGTGIGPSIPNGSNFAGLEYALGRLYGTANGVACGGSDLRILNPSTGASTLVGGTTLVAVTGLAFDARASAMYGVETSACGDTSHLYRVDLTDGSTTSIGAGIGALGALEFGPEGDLYAAGGGLNSNSGKLYRVHPGTGVARLVGPTGSSGITGLALAPGWVAAAGDPIRSPLTLRASPNPARSGIVSIAFALPVPGDAALEVFDVAGRSVWRHTLNGLAAGERIVAWDGRGPDGRRVAGGVYLVRLVTESGSRSTRVVQLD